MPFYTLSPGQSCGYCGRDLQPGEVIELPERIGDELRGKLTRVLEPGDLSVVRPPSGPPFVVTAPPSIKAVMPTEKKSK